MTDTPDPISTIPLIGIGIASSIAKDAPHQCGTHLWAPACLCCSGVVHAAQDTLLEGTHLLPLSMLACTITDEYAVLVLASPSVFHSFGSNKDILLSIELLFNSSSSYSKVQSGRIYCSEVRIRCRFSNVWPLRSNVVDSKLVCSCFVPQVIVRGAFTVV